jgi:hypothetical protein
VDQNSAAGHCQLLALPRLRQPGQPLHTSRPQQRWSGLTATGPRRWRALAAQLLWRPRLRSSRRHPTLTLRLRAASRTPSGDPGCHCSHDDHGSLTAVTAGQANRALLSGWSLRSRHGPQGPGGAAGGHWQNTRAVGQTTKQMNLKSAMGDVDAEQMFGRISSFLDSYSSPARSGQQFRAQLQCIGVEGNHRTGQRLHLKVYSG